MSGRNTFTIWQFALQLLFGLSSAAACGDDRVVVQLSKQSSRITIVGRIEDYNGRELVIHTGVGAGIKRVHFDEVIEITTAYSAAHLEGRKLLAEGRVADAWSRLTAALEDEDRGWVRREILALQIECGLRQGDYTQAASRFLAIAQSDPVTPHYRLIPLAWTESALPGMSATEARHWLTSEILPARLLGASWLLLSRDPAEASQVMRALAGESHPYIQRLAQAQLWRLRLAEGNLPAAEVQRWEQLNDEWPTVLRGGPYFLIGCGFGERQEWLSAAAAWMWLPVEYAHRRDLAAEAQLRAASAMAAAGDNAAAIRLAQEAATRYADTPQGVEARALIDRLSAAVPRASIPSSGN